MSGVADKRNPVLDCCGGLNNVDYSKVDMSVMEDVLKHIDVYDPRFCVAVIAIIFNPFFWNVLIRPHDSQWSQTVGAQTTVCMETIAAGFVALNFNIGFSSSVLSSGDKVARWEHRTRGLTRLFGGPYLACYCLGTLIILLNVYRSHSMTVAMKAQARWEVMANPEVFYAGAALMALGSVLVVTSFLALGFTGTFLGDYFGILMEEKVKGFPFNVTENPMYWGSTANYLGLAFMNASPVGLVLTAVVAISYQVAIIFEGPFTEDIYRQRAQCCKHK